MKKVISVIFEKQEIFTFEELLLENFLEFFKGRFIRASLSVLDLGETHSVNFMFLKKVK